MENYEHRKSDHYLDNLNYLISLRQHFAINNKQKTEVINPKRPNIHELHYYPY